MIRRPPRSTLFPYTRSSDLSTWLTGSYDPETDTLYWSTGNPFPNSDDGNRSGDNLYTKDRKSTRLNSSHLVISYAVFCLKKKCTHNRRKQHDNEVDSRLVPC